MIRCLKSKRNPKISWILPIFDWFLGLIEAGSQLLIYFLKLLLKCTSMICSKRLKAVILKLLPFYEGTSCLRLNEIKETIKNLTSSGNCLWILIILNLVLFIIIVKYLTKLLHINKRINNWKFIFTYPYFLRLLIFLVPTAITTKEVKLRMKNIGFMKNY